MEPHLEKISYELEGKNLEEVISSEFIRLGIPNSGVANTLQGEVVRALAKLRYRYYNDGDYFYTGYGAETAGPAASFIKDYFKYSGFSNISKEIDDCANNVWTGLEYEQFLSEITHFVLVYTLSCTSLTFNYSDYLETESEWNNDEDYSSDSYDEDGA